MHHSRKHNRGTVRIVSQWCNYHDICTMPERENSTSSALQHQTGTPIISVGSQNWLTPQSSRAGVIKLVHSVLSCYYHEVIDSRPATLSAALHLLSLTVWSKCVSLLFTTTLTIYRGTWAYQFTILGGHLFGMIYIQCRRERITLLQHCSTRGCDVDAHHQRWQPKLLDSPIISGKGGQISPLCYILLLSCSNWFSTGRTLCWPPFIVSNCVTEVCHFILQYDAD